MNRLLTLLGLCLLATVSMALTPVTPTDPVRPLGTVIQRDPATGVFVYGEDIPQQNTGLRNDVATPTFSVTSAQTIFLPDYMPEGYQGYEIRCASGSFVIGGSYITTSPVRIGRLVSAGESYTFNGNVGTGSAYIKSPAGADIVIDAVWGDTSL